jgi:hypothetical protein
MGSFQVRARKRVSSNARVANTRCCRDVTKNRCPSTTMSSRDWPTTKTPAGLCTLWDRQLNPYVISLSLRILPLSGSFTTATLAGTTEVVHKENFI